VVSSQKPAWVVRAGTATSQRRKAVAKQKKIDTGKSCQKQVQAACAETDAADKLRQFRRLFDQLPAEHAVAGLRQMVVKELESLATEPDVGKRVNASARKLLEKFRG
jgi:hypothetical protein